MANHGPDNGALEAAGVIVASYVANNKVASADLTTLIQTVHGALTKLADEVPAGPLKPAVSVKKSVTPDYLISMEDGRHYKMLKLHLTTLGMTPDAYRRKWGLSADYPMVAQNYSNARSAIAKSIGLGSAGRKAPPSRSMPTLEPVPSAPGPKAPRAKRSRRPKAIDPKDDQFT